MTDERNIILKIRDIMAGLNRIISILGEKKKKKKKKLIIAAEETRGKNKEKKINKN